MTAKAKPIPKGFHTITPHLIVRDAAKAIDFYQRAFGAEASGVHRTPDGKIMHAELKIGDSYLMLNDEFPEMKICSPATLGGSPVTIHLYVEDVDALFNQAVGAGATATMPVMDQFWGDRYGKVCDPFGHNWSIATHKEDVNTEELTRRGAAAMAEMSKQRSSSSQH